MSTELSVEMRYRCGHVKKLAYFHEGTAEHDRQEALRIDCWDCRNAKIVAETAAKNRDKSSCSQ